MSIEINTAAKGVNWESLLSSIGDVQKADSVDGKQSFTITTNVNGEARTLTVNVPNDLEIPETVDQGTLEGLVDKLKATGLGFTDEQVAQMKGAIAKLYADTQSALSSVASKSTGQVLFDLYALMALMIDVAQSQRDAAREMRTAENLAMQKAIQNQADDQRSAAMVGLLVGVTCGIVSAGASLGLMAWQGVTASTQDKIMAQSGADAAKMHSQALQNTDSPAHAETHLAALQQKPGGGDISNRVSAEFDSNLVDAQAGDLRTNLSNANTRVSNAEQSLATKTAELETAQQTLEQKTQAKNDAQTRVDSLNDSINAYWEKNTYIRTQGQNADPNVIAEFNNRIGPNAENFNVNQAHTDLEAAQVDLNRANTELTEAQNDVRVKQGAVDLANTELTNAKTELAQAKANYCKTVSDVAAQYEEKYQTAVERLHNPPAGADKAQLKADVDTAKNEMEMAFAMEAKYLTKDGAMTPAEQKDLVASARARVDVTTDRATHRMDFRAAERRLSMISGLNNINQSIAQVTQAMSANLSATRNAEATRQGADTKKEEEMLDQTKDLFSQEQKLIDQVVQLFSAVIQAESQSMRDAIQA